MKLEVERKWLLAGAIGAALLVLIVVLAWQIKSIDIPLVSEGGTPTRESEIAEYDVNTEELEVCMTFWNGAGNEAARRTVAVMEASYASATFSSLYPDRCLITVANPELDLATQFLEGGLEGEVGEKSVSFDQVKTGSASSLDPSVTRWNLIIGLEGSLTLKPNTNDPRY